MTYPSVRTKMRYVNYKLSWCPVVREVSDARNESNFCVGSSKVNRRARSESLSWAINSHVRCKRTCGGKWENTRVSCCF